MPVTTSRTTRGMRTRRDHGASAVEMALVLPILVALMLGVITGGIAYSRTVSLNDAVRGGARVGATTVDGTSWAGTVRQRTVDYSADGLALGQVCAQLVKGSTILRSECSLTGSAATPPANPAGTLSTDCLVKVWAVRSVSIVAVPFTDFDVDVERHSVSRYERTCP